MFTSSNNEQEIRNNDPVISGLLRKPSFWRKRFKIKKKYDSNGLVEKTCSPETPSTPLDRDENIFTFDVNVSPLQNSSTWMNEENEKCKWNGKSNEKDVDRLFRRFSTYSLSSFHSDLTDSGNTTNSNEIGRATTQSLKKASRLSQSCESLFINCKKLENSENLSTIYDEESNLFADYTSIYENKSRQPTGPPVSPNRRKQGTTNYPVIRGRHINQLTHQESLECSLNLLDLPVNTKRPRAGSPSRFGKKIARKFATLSQNQESLLLHAVANQDYEMIEKLISGEDNSYDINYQYPPGVTILHQACVIGDFDVVKLFVEKGADVNRKTWNNLSPAKLAVLYGHFDVAQLLLLAGADVDDIKNGIQIEDRES